MANDFFRDVGTAIFKPVGDFISGGVTALQPGRVQQMQELLKTEQGQRLLRSSQIAMNEARARAMDRGEGLYGGRGVDSNIKVAEDLGKIQAAREKFVFGKMKPETAAYFDAAEKSLLDRMKTASTPKERGFVGPPAPRGRMGENAMETSKSAAEYFQPGIDRVEPIDRAIKSEGGRASLPKTDNRDYFASGGELDVFEKMGAPKQRTSPDAGMFDRLDSFKAKTRGAESIADYFQAATETVPIENIPKTYKQLGVTNIDEQVTLDEMQKSLPDVDMRREYENDPESMKRLMQLWKTRNINKSNLRQFFPAIQQKAREALGID